MGTSKKRAFNLRMLGFGLAVGVAALGIAVGSSQQTPVKSGQKAPDFSATGTDGKTHTLSSTTKKSATVLYFIKEGCPVNHRAAPFLSKIAEKYGADANIVGVYNGSVDRAKAWAKTYKATYTILADPDYKIIESYKAPYSPFMIVVGKDGKIAEVYTGAGPKDLPKINELCSKNADKKMVAMDFTGAPDGGG
ncbi:MAG: redoxin domain-containing protein [Fimbriimonadaceae bacterium]|nr:redoxin domain-containing protein [Fimbriimonadaceae bacterium]